MMHGSGFNNVTIKDSQTPWVCLYVLWFPCKRRPANLEATLKHFNVLCRSSVPLLVSFWDSSKYNEVSLRWMKWNTLQLQKVSSQANIDRFLHFLCTIRTDPQESISLLLTWCHAGMFLVVACCLCKEEAKTDPSICDRSAF